jgi:RNA polymerase sigma-70 factor, ECF subfamily
MISWRRMRRLRLMPLKHDDGSDCAVDGEVPIGPDLPVRRYGADLLARPGTRPAHRNFRRRAASYSLKWSRVSKPCVKSEDVAVLVGHAQDGVEGALEELVRRYQDRIAGFIYSLIGREDAIADLCHNVFVKMIVNIGRLRTPQSFESWLFQIARNTCFDHLRKERLRRIFVPFERKHEEVAAQPAERADSRLDILRRALGNLPPKQRELILLLEENDFSYEELAQITRASVASVKSRLFRAREQLRRRLADDS